MRDVQTLDGRIEMEETIEREAGLVAVAAKGLVAVRQVTEVVMLLEEALFGTHPSSVDHPGPVGEPPIPRDLRGLVLAMNGEVGSLHRIARQVLDRLDPPAGPLGGARPQLDPRDMGLEEMRRAARARDVYPDERVVR